MLRLRGTLLNVIKREPRPGADRQFEPYGQAQLQTEEVLDDGQVKIGLHTLSFDVPQIAAFEAVKGKPVELPVRAYVKGTTVAFAIEAGATPQAVQRPSQGVSGAGA